MAPGARVVDLFEELCGVDHDAVPDQVHRPFPQHTGGEEMERVEVLAHLDRVARVRATVETDDDVRPVREEVDHLPLAFVPPLQAKDHRRGHGTAARWDLPT